MMKDIGTELEIKCVNTIRMLAVDATQKANSGHPGAPLGMAAMGYALFDGFMKHSPANPEWPDRDRFALSAGHASMLLYSLLHLSGYDLPLDELRNFRQLGSRTPGHPERDLAAGVEISTGPLGQGLAHAVGMALAEARLAARFNKPGFNIVDHNTYVVCSDGDIQEGLSTEAASLAGHLALGKLICLYDDNGIQIEGRTSLAFGENVAAKFKALGWQVIGPVDGFDIPAVRKALRRARRDASKPSLIICKTIIGRHSPLEDSEKSHGSPLGADNAVATKKALGWPLEPEFIVPLEVAAHMRKAVARGKRAESKWSKLFSVYEKLYPADAKEFLSAMKGELPQGWESVLEGVIPADSKPMATRAASGKALNALFAKLPNLIGGSADLGPSNNTRLAASGSFSATDRAANNIHFGVREHAMAAVCGGIALHGGLIPYAGTFFTFADYMRPSIRLAAIMGVRVIYVFTHDSIGVGEDGPTHQPVEHLMSLRAMPNVTVIRPADAAETVEAWRAALLNSSGPTALVLSRQNLPCLDRAEYPSAANLHKGAYTLWQAREGAPDAIIIATGSEVEIALAAARALAEEGVNARAVSMPSWELFDAQTPEYKESVLPDAVRARVAVEAGIRTGWERYAGLDGEIVGMDGFGASGPASALFKKFGFVPGAVADAARRVVAKQKTKNGGSAS